jgi:glucose-6-phosphate 1-dehydrogenase
MLQHNPMLTVRDDEAEELWRIVEPVLGAWSAGTAPLREYPAGTPGLNPFEDESGKSPS